MNVTADKSIEPLTLSIAYDAVRLLGRISRSDVDSTSSIWDRLRSKAVGELSGAFVHQDAIELPWPGVLDIVREYGTKQLQQELNFRFRPIGEAEDLIKRFSQEFKKARSSRNLLTSSITANEIQASLQRQGFVKRTLKDFQLRDLELLASLPHGANFSVPGAGKTTVTLALNLITKRPETHLFVIGPKAAFPAWRGVVAECMEDDAPDNGAEPFTVLEGSQVEVERLLRAGGTRFVMSYDLMVRQQRMLSAYFARQPVHLVLDEAHRMKAGLASQRGAFLLGIANLPARRDILTGTPMPQGSDDLASQLGFLWPGHGFDLQIARGVAPREVLGQLYVRTTKHELGLPPAKRHFHQIEMARGQMALYGIVRSEALRQISGSLGARSHAVDVLGARRSVMRLLQLSVNPILAISSMSVNTHGLTSGIVEQVLNEGPSTKMQAVVQHVRELAKVGKKAVVWTIFTDTIRELERMLADLNPVSLYGAVPTGDASDSETREGRLSRFHLDEACKVMIANPAAAGEGISLHMVCHDALYLDRSYVSTHYLQSIDRIHRLGLPPDVETNIHIYQTKAPAGLGSIDASVSRRLAVKVRNLQELLNDNDLHQIALDEENADEAVDFDVDLDDLVDLVQELEGHAPHFVEDEA